MCIRAGWLIWTSKENAIAAEKWLIIDLFEKMNFKSMFTFDNYFLFSAQLIMEM